MTSTSPHFSSKDADTFESRAETITTEMDLGTAHVRWTGRPEGDVGIEARGDVEKRRRAIERRPWSWLTQVHGALVVDVDGPGSVRGATGDSLVGGADAGPLAIFTADCAPVAFSSPEGILGAAHAGWRGLAAGVLEATVAAMRARGATTVSAALGPCIRVECYAFSPADLTGLADRLGGDVVGRTAAGLPALDLAAGVRSVLGRLAVDVADQGSCTACDDRWFSYRARGDRGRQATIIVAR